MKKGDIYMHKEGTVSQLVIITDEPSPHIGIVHIAAYKPTASKIYITSFPPCVSPGYHLKKVSKETLALIKLNL